jgi:AcrR family transcriptional regulator
MSLATLAKATAMSKSGLFAHFRSKEALQIAIIDEAERIFFEVVVRPAQDVPAGIERLKSLVRAYVDYCAAGPFEGGCFFAAAVHEFDGRPGAVRDRLIAFLDGWRSALRTAGEEAQQKGQLKQGVDIDDLAFEVQGLGLSANYHAQIGAGRDPAGTTARRCADALLQRITA